MSKQEPTKEEIIKTIEEFARTNPRDYEIIRLISSEYEGWAELSNGETVYIHQPQKSGKEIGEAFKYVLNNMDNYKERFEKLSGIDVTNKSMTEVLDELSSKWKSQ